MTKKDYYYVAKLFVYSNKKQSKNISRSFLYGLIFLIFALFILFSFYITFLSQVKSEKLASTVTLEYNNLKNGYIDTEVMPEIIENENLNSTITLSNYDINYYDKFVNSSREIRYPIINFDGTDYKYHNKNKYYGKGDTFTFFDLENTTQLITDEEEKYLQKNNLGKGILAGSYFTENINEVIVSSIFLDYINVDYDEAIGKKISYSLNLYGSGGKYIYYSEGGDLIDISDNSEMIQIFVDYEIVGVFNSKVNAIPSRECFYGKEFTELFWFKEKSFYFTDKINIGKNYLNYIFDEKVENLLDDAKSKKQVFIPFGYNTSGNSGNREEQYTQILNFKDFNSVLNFIDNVSNYRSVDKLEEKSQENITYYVESGTINTYLEFKPIIDFCLLVLFILGGILLLIAIINIYLTSSYSINRSEKFLSMCQAVGMTKNDILWIFNFKMMIIIGKTIVFSLIISLILSVLIMLGFNNIISPNQISNNFNFTINLNYFPLTFVLITGIISIISILMNLIICQKFNKKNILQILNE